MINIYCDNKAFEYDIHSLFKAFYPREEIRVCLKEEETSGRETPGLDFYIGYDGFPEACFVIPEKREDPSEEEAFSGACVIRIGNKEQEKETELTLRQAFDRGFLKNALKRLIYSFLSGVSKKELPWGTLTGIRPVKLAASLLSSEKDEEAVRKRLKEEYYVSGDKISLSLEIVKREQKIIEGTRKAEGYSLYIGIPFCPTTCLYCSFTSFPIAAWRDKTELYLACLEKEILAVSKLFEGRSPDSIYIGGGTPTTLSPEQLTRLIACLKENLPFSGLKELTVEAGRPDSITQEKLAALKEAGVSRISINPQTMNDETLVRIGRRHTTEQIRESFYLARKMGFDNINMDLILGLPGEGYDEIVKTFTEIEKLGPDSVTVHSMAIKRAAKMGDYLKEHSELLEKGEEDYERIMELAVSKCLKMGLLAYYLYRQKNMAGNLENVGFAREGKFGIYNILIMEEIQDIVALGAGTVTKRVYYDRESGEKTGRIERCDNVKDVGLYMEKLDEMIGRKIKLFSDEQT